MKKILVLTSALAIGFTACDKKEPSPASASNKHSNVNLRTIVTGAPATRTWDAKRGDCFNGGQDCLDEVECVAAAPIGLWELIYKAITNPNTGPEDIFRVYSDYASNDAKKGLTEILGADNYNAILSGELLLKIRMNPDKPNTIFLGLFEGSNPDRLVLVVPITKMQS
jgi:hypothetical protein